MFVEIVDQTGSVENTFTYTGREWDEEIGLYYYRARFYDGGIGRFICEDPIGFKSGDVNFYRYVFSNPINHIDPTGLKLMSCIRPSRDKRLGALGLQHAYIWDTRTGKSAGQGADPFRSENGPSGSEDCCISIPNSEGKEELVFSLASRTMRNEWFPATSDCHIWANYTLTLAGLENPLSYWDRFGNPKKACSKKNECGEPRKDCPCESE